MKIILQRVKNAEVAVENEKISQIGRGLLVFLAVEKKDEESGIEPMIDKIINLRIFSDENGKTNLSLLDVSGELLIVSQFTLLADCSKGRRPSFINAAPPEKAEDLYKKFVQQCKKRGIGTQEGKFQAMMDISLTNDGPFTIVL